jgi:hypothetical protein
MPLPTPSDVHVNRPLTNISIAMMQEESNFIASEVFPIVPVQKQSDVYLSYDNAYWNRDEMSVRAPATESEGGGYAIDSSPTYYCPIYSIHKDIPDEMRANADVPINVDREATLYVTQKALIKRERLFAASFMAGGVWTRDYDGVSSSPSTNEVLQWNDAASTPIQDVWDAKEEILERTGYEPNRLVLGYPVYKALINHPDIVDRVKYGGGPARPGVIDVGELAQVFKVEKVLVSRGIYNTALEGGTKSHSFINGKKALLAYAAPTPGVFMPSAGYIFSWQGYLGAGPQGNRILRLRLDFRHCDRIEIEIAFDMKLTAADLGAFWDNVVA